MRFAFNIVVGGRVQPRGNILDQAAAEIHIEHLEAPADAQHRQSAFHRQIEQRPFGAVACGRDILRVGVGLFVARRVDVAAAGQQDRFDVERIQIRANVRQVVRDDDRSVPQTVHIRYIIGADHITGGFSIRGVNSQGNIHAGCPLP